MRLVLVFLATVVQALADVTRYDWKMLTLMISGQKCENLDIQAQSW